jgi:GTP-binding protein
VPNLGVVKYGSFQSFVMADIPGLIEGASEGHGLGTRFLRHIERTDLFLHLVDLSDLQPGDALERFDAINHELEKHNPLLLEKPQMVVLSKADLTEVRDRVEQVRPFFEKRGYRILVVSAVTGQGVPELVATVGRELERLRRSEARTGVDPA